MYKQSTCLIELMRRQYHETGTVGSSPTYSDLSGITDFDFSLFDLALLTKLLKQDSL
jgi:hypothetical protein